MFTQPFLQPGEAFPRLPETEEFHALLGATGIKLEAGVDTLQQATDHAIHVWIDEACSSVPNSKTPCEEVPQYPALQSAGLINAIRPSRDFYDHGVVDGGSKPVYDLRLGALDTELQAGLDIPEITIFGGQRLRFAKDDQGGVLEAIAQDVISENNPWAQEWIERQLNRTWTPSNPWDRPFATEHEVAMLALMQRYGDRLEHLKTEWRGVTMVKPQNSIPPAPIQAELFALDDKVIRVLNGQAVTRQLRGYVFPPEESRPTALSCFYEWHQLAKPEQDASVLLTTHNPNIYRSWLDLTLGLQALNRTDIRLEGSGAAIEPGRSYGYVLGALGRLLVNFYNNANGTHNLYPTDVTKQPVAASKA